MKLVTGKNLAVNVIVEKSGGGSGRKRKDSRARGLGECSMRTTWCHIMLMLELKKYDIKLY